MGRLRNLTGDAIEYAPSQETAARFPQISRDEFEKSVWLVEPGGKVTSAAEAFFRTLSSAGKKKWLLWSYENVPGFGQTSEEIYKLVSRHRGGADRLDRWLLPDPNDRRQSYAIMRSVFLRALGIVYLAAFLSLGVQLDGLIGSRGILPVGEFLSAVHAGSFTQNFLRLPTLCWINSSDGLLHVLCDGGAVLSCVLIVGIMPMPVLAMLWLFYLSLVNVGQVFLGYQWDALLLEAGFLAIFFAPLDWRLRAGSPPSRTVLFLLRWLLFRLMFLSGIVKLTSGDATWRSLTAMRYHYQTQPLPTWTSWYAHLAPNWFQSISVAGVLFIEVAVPIFFFAPRSRRLLACTLTILFQVLIAATGNYGFFNLLAIVLCLTLIDDAAWRNIVGRAVPALRGTMQAGFRRREVPWWLTAPLALCLIPLTFVPALQWIGYDRYVPAPLERAYASVSQFDSINAYGLFANMTTQRPELIIEGSDDGKFWLAYEFKWQPGDVNHRPRFCSPHMPRLDWQMWFAALDIYYNHRLESWLPAFLDRLHEGSPAVLGLMETNPFPDHPPRYLRVEVYDYRFTTYAQRRASGDWWQRENLGELPVQQNP